MKKLQQGNANAMVELVVVATGRDLEMIQNLSRTSLGGTWSVKG
jgi:hypothetical protein